MGRAAKRFFFTSRRYGINKVVLCLTETRLADWKARKSYLEAKDEQEDLYLYGLDMLWLLTVSRYPDAELPQPSKMHQKQDTRTAEQIKQHILSRLG